MGQRYSLTSYDLKEAELQGTVHWHEQLQGTDARHSIASVRPFTVWTLAILLEPAKKLAFLVALLCSESA